jgi:ABC-type Fe3+-hydroxamate transport system substrate-binding protein
MFIQKPLHVKPNRIVSLVPSITELLFYLKLNNETVGITKFCVHPKEWFSEKAKIGGTKNINIDLVKSLNPDLIICCKEENVKEQIDELSKQFNVLLTDVVDYNTALETILNIGTHTHTFNRALKLVKEIDYLFEKLDLNYTNNTALYLIWKKPFMAAGGDTFINSMIQKAGFKNIFEKSSRYPEVTIQTLIELKPAFVLLSTEPFPFKEKDVNELQQLIPHSKIILVNGEIFSWYGSRTLLAPSYFQNLHKQISI